MRRILLAALLALPTTALAQLNAAYDAYITKAMADHKVPGLAIAVVRNDSVIFAKGYGTRTMGKQEPVDENTLFAIGSSSKAFTATLVAMLVDEGKLRWDDPANSHLPALELFDPYASKELTIRDLLSHRSGLARGDLMWYATDYDRDDILRRVRFQRPSTSLRSNFGYQNVMYLAAGQATAKVTGKSWDAQVHERIFTPLGMTSSNTSTKALAGKPNVATPHTDVDDTLRIVPWKNIDNIAPAGSINSSVRDMAQWVRLQLAQGKWNGKPLVSTGALGETHTPQMIIRLSADAKSINPFSHLQAYGLGWFLQDYRGRELRHHGGNIDGMSALVAFIPEEKLGLVVLTNANGSSMPTIAAYRAFDALMKAPERDWSAEFMKVRAKQMAAGREALNKRLAGRVTGTKPSLDLAKYAGTYADSMYGDVTVSVTPSASSVTPSASSVTPSGSEGSALRVRYGTAYDGTLEHWHFDTFRAKWNSVTMGRSFVTFALDADGKVKNIELEGLSTFGRKPDAQDTTRRVILASSDAVKLTGTYVSQMPALTVDVSWTDGQLKMTVPGQPVYTLLADSPTRFRMTGPPGMPAGFFADFELAGGKVKQLTLIQPSPRPSITFQPK